MNSNNELMPLDKLFNGLIKKFNSQKAKGVDITYKFIFKDYADPIYVEVKNEVARILPKNQTPSKIDTTLTMSHKTWQKICFKETSGKKALLLGKVKCSGSLKNFALMPEIFDKELQ